MNAKFPCRLAAGALLLVTSLAWSQDQEPKALELDYPPAPVTTGIQPSSGENCDAFWVLWVDRPIPLRSLTGREVITKQKRTTLELKDREEKRVVTEIVLKPREVERVVPCCTLRSEKVTDPATGHCCTVTKVVTEDKVVKETVYDAVEEKRTVTIKVPYLKSVDIEVPQKSILFECKHEFRPDGYPVLVPDYIYPDRFFVGPCPACAPDAPCAKCAH